MKKFSSERHGLPVIHDRAAGIDIGSRFHVVAVPADLAEESVRTFTAFTADLERMANWLTDLGITTVAMESTGVYWIPVYEILETHGLHVVLANARDARAVPGRKTDVNDAQWIQRLHACGLLRASFHPDREIAALRSYLRLRERHLDYAAAHIQHMQKALTREEARSDVFDYIEMFYNPKRRHSSAMQLSPVEFEKRYFQSLESV